jgi:hypothetical protein
MRVLSSQIFINIACNYLSFFERTLENILYFISLQRTLRSMFAIFIIPFVSP